MSYMTIRNHKVNRSASHGVMENSGFGALTIFRRDGAIIEIPQAMIDNEGFVKSGLVKDLRVITADKINSLEKRGVKLFVGKAG